VNIFLHFQFHIFFCAPPSASGPFPAAPGRKLSTGTPPPAPVGTEGSAATAGLGECLRGQWAAAAAAFLDNDRSAGPTALPRLVALLLSVNGGTAWPQFFFFAAG